MDCRGTHTIVDGFMSAKVAIDFCERAAELYCATCTDYLTYTALQVMQPSSLSKSCTSALSGH